MTSRKVLKGGYHSQHKSTRPPINIATEEARLWRFEPPGATAMVVPSTLVRAGFSGYSARMVAGGKFCELAGIISRLCCALVSLALPALAANAAVKGTMQLSSSAFSEGGAIPARYTCDGENVSPPLKWSGAPSGTKSFALIVDDPDAPVGTWVHWVLYDFPATATELAEGTPKSQYIPGGAKQGLNDFKHLGYGGPCPPPGKAHRYFFKLYALDRVIELKPGAMKKELEAAMEKYKLGEGQLIGTYKRR